ncbi:DUF3231 family protein [Priestia megaterium]
MQQNTRLTAPEISNLWAHYIRETLSLRVNQYMIHIVKDQEIHNLFQVAIDRSLNHIDTLKKFFKKEKFPVPKGFTEEDVNLNAPPLFTDTLCLKSLFMMSQHGSNEYSLSHTNSIRKDITSFYYQCNMDAMDLFQRAKELLISKKLYKGPSEYITPKKTMIIEDYSYVTDIFGSHRHINSVESGHTYFNLYKTLISKAMILGFTQVAKDSKVRSTFEKALEAKNKNIKAFSTLLAKENLQIPQSLETEVTDSTVSPFSDKLMLMQAGFLFGVAVTYFNAALIASMRVDIAAHCEKAALESLWAFNRIGKLMIDNQWMEKPPQADSRTKIN